ncbi:hypothetical protein E0K89_006185 [Aquicoccus sp. SCR17]|nr:hypothetical protein [Carideicomes alvinocaridis]
MKDPMQTLLQDLEAVLEDERQALTRGDVPALSGLVARKQAAIERLGHTGEPPGANAPQDTLARLRRKAQRNQDLMDHALRGLRDVAARLDKHERPDRPLETYDSGGRRQALGDAGGGSIERRA